MPSCEKLSFCENTVVNLVTMSVMLRKLPTISHLLLQSPKEITSQPCFAQCILNFQRMFTPTKDAYLKDSRKHRRIRGGGRPVPEGVTVPIGRVYGFQIVFPEDGKYTTKALPILKLGGRDPKTGRVVVRTIGGGHKKHCYWVDHKRTTLEDGSAKDERVFRIHDDPCRTAKIALVANGDHKRWITASEHMKAGDVIKTSAEIPRMPVRPEDGNAYAVGALPQGSIIHNIEPKPGFGGIFCRAAGSSAQLLRKIDDKCLVQLPSKEQILISEKCMVVSGRASNVGHGAIPMGGPWNMRALGKRPRSGLWHRKDGYCGRKIHPPKPIKDLLLDRQPEQEVYELSYPDS